MFKELLINSEYLPRPTEDLSFKSEKIKNEYESEAGTTLVSVSRTSKLTISGTWLLTGKWMSKFRDWSYGDTVEVLCFYPSKQELTSHTCQLSIESEKHIKYSRDKLNVDGLYEVSVKLEEL